MANSIVGKQLQTAIPLQVKPTHQEIPSLTGSAISPQKGTVLYGHYSMDYDLPDGDKLRLVANHNKSNVQIILLTHDPEKLKQLPGHRPSSLIADMISQVNRYLLRSNSYSKPLTAAQKEKYRIAQKCIHSLCLLLEKERVLATDDWASQETLRIEVINLLEESRDANRLLANNPVVSEGSLGDLLYDAKQKAQHYQFNRAYPVSRIDQLDFSQTPSAKTEKKPCYVWDSETHIGFDEQGIDDTLRTICQLYNLEQAKKLSSTPSNRFDRLERFFSQLYQDGHDWLSYLALPQKPKHQQQVETRADGLTITHIKPYYQLTGFKQISYPSLDDLVHDYSNTKYPEFKATSILEAERVLADKANGNWVNISAQNQVVIRLNDQMTVLHYYQETGLFFALPHGDDLYTLSQLSKRHLYLPERLGLQFKAFFSRIPSFFSYAYKSLHKFVTHDLHDDFVNHVHKNHSPPTNSPVPKEPEVPAYIKSLQEVLIGHGLLNNGQSLEEFVQQSIADSHYIIAREEHRPSPIDYNNPAHNLLGVLRHLGGFFVNTSEKNPVVGLLALLAYVYGAGAIIAPQALTAILTKLHLHGLIKGIEFTQELGKWMSHGTTSEAISAAITYWQGMVIVGNMDSFFIQAVSLLKDDPAEVAIIVALAIGLGYGLCKIIPPLQEEMGRFPYTNYAALGAKGGAAIYDTVMHPGDDWLLGGIKWLLRSLVTLSKLLIAPFVELGYYGLQKGFVSGWKKSGRLFIQTTKQLVAATADLSLALLSIPFLEISALLIHVPFRGVTDFLSKTIGALGQWGPIGAALINFAIRDTSWNFLPGFRFSPLYGFTNPLGTYHSNGFVNVLCNIGMLLFLALFQLLKNLILLPILDLLSISVRLILTCLNPISRIITYGLGAILLLAGPIWDNSIGEVLQILAHGITLTSNWIDKQAGTIKQFCLAHIQIWRRALYHWAFKTDDKDLHEVNTDSSYFMEKPIRLEQLHHDSTHCLLANLLNKSSANKRGRGESSNFPSSSLFSPGLSAVTQTEAEQNTVNRLH